MTRAEEINEEIPVMLRPSNDRIFSMTVKATDMASLILQGMGITISERDQAKLEKVLGEIITEKMT